MKTKSLKTQLNRAQAFAGSPKARNLYRASLNEVMTFEDREAANLARIAELESALKQVLDCHIDDKRSEGVTRFGFSIERTNEIIEQLPQVIIARQALASGKEGGK